jgi:hypothetical protein
MHEKNAIFWIFSILEHLRAADADLNPFKKVQILRLNKKHAKKLPTRFSEMYAGDSLRKKKGAFWLFWD